MSHPENQTLTWPYIKRIIDRVHKHVCGHAAYSDIRTLLKRNNMLNQTVQHYLGRVIHSFHNCVQSSSPQPTRKVSLSSLDSAFNDTVYIDHMYLDDMKVFHVMDMHSRYLSCMITRSTNMSESIVAFQCFWLNAHWTTRVVRADPAFLTGEFSTFSEQNGFELSVIPTRRHNKNTLEPNHGIIRAIYSR